MQKVKEKQRAKSKAAGPADIVEVEEGSEASEESSVDSV
jgi:hypothetical protein